ncbi:MAG: helix-turn-helix domain-containing protein [Corynebacterium sp.]|nr:helix-turn-helix domain-containing protein [Corynebacterium sp.]MDN6387569.1 helix-turn-helix domain-containing protein [Corynebacterium sp.]
MSDEDSGRNEAATVVPFRRRAETPDKAPDTTPAKTPAKLWRDALGEEIHRQRTVRRDRLVDTAGRAGISPQYLSELERGMKDPSSEVLEAVAGALGKSSFELVRSASVPTGPVLLAA